MRFNMWSIKGMFVSIWEFPVPSRLKVTAIEVSVVFLSMVAFLSIPINKDKDERCRAFELGVEISENVNET